MKRLVQDEGNPCMSKYVQQSIWEIQTSARLYLLIFSKSRCLPIVQILSAVCLRARLLLECSPSKRNSLQPRLNISAFHITGSSVAGADSDVSLVGGGASANRITAHKRQLGNPSVGDPDIMDVFQDVFQSPSKLVHGAALGVKTGLAHEVIAHSSVFARRLPEYIGQSTCMSRDGIMHD